MLYTQSLCPEEQQRCGFLSLQYLQTYIQTHVHVQQLWGEWAAISCIACTGEGHPVTTQGLSFCLFLSCFCTFSSPPANTGGHSQRPLYLLEVFWLESLRFDIENLDGSEFIFSPT